MTVVEFVQEERVVSAFMIKEENNEEVLKSRGRAVDQLMLYKGEMVFEAQVKEQALLLVVAFENESFLNCWKAVVSPVVLNPVNNCRVVHVLDPDLKKAAQVSENVQKSVRENHGVVLKTKLCDIHKNEYRILVYFKEDGDLENWKEEKLPLCNENDCKA